MANSIGDDRRWIIEQWNYLYGRQPTQAELDKSVALIRGGWSRSAWMSLAEKGQTQDAVTRLYKNVLGRAPTAAELSKWSKELAQGKTTRKNLTQYLNDSSEALLKPPAKDEPTKDENDALAYLKGVLGNYGLSALGDWAWNQIQAGHSSERILQDLRETAEYKQRFKGMELRKAAGLSAISEGEYIAYERETRQMMRAAGLPAEFYDQPDDFANFIGHDVSASELNARINDGYAAASAAPPEVAAELKRLYGIDSGALAAYFLDPDRALPVLERQWTATKLSGAAVRTGYGALSQGEAESLAALGVTSDQAQQGFAGLADNAELFGALPGERGSDISRSEQQAAVFGSDAKARERIDHRVGERKSAASGAGSFSVGQGGVGGLAQD